MARRFGKLAALAGARRLARSNAPAVHRGIDGAARAVKGRLGSRHSSKVDGISRMAKKALTGSESSPDHGRARGRATARR